MQPQPFTRRLSVALIALATFAANAQFRPAQPETAPITVKPVLEAKLRSGEFEEWGQRIDIAQPREITFRWGPARAGERIDIHVYETSLARESLTTGVAGGLQSAGRVRVFTQGDSAAPGLGMRDEFVIDFANLLPESPGNKRHRYQVQVKSRSDSSRSTNVVEVAYGANDSATSFGFLDLHPEFQRPMRVKINLSSLELLKTDEDCGDEPYLIPMVIYADGTTLDFSALPTSSVRTKTPVGPPQGNITAEDDICQGRRLSIPDSTGYFEDTIVPINLRDVGILIPGCTPSSNDDCRLNFTQISNATTVWLVVVAFEHDATSEDVATAARDAVVEEFRTTVNQCINALTLADLATMQTENFDLFLDFTSDVPAIDYCGMEASENNSIARQIGGRLRSTGFGAALDEVLGDVFFDLSFGHPLVIGDLVDADDFIGFGWRVFSYDELMRADGGLSFEMVFEAIDDGELTMQYKLTGSAARCEPKDGFCETQTRPLSNNPAFQ